MGGSFDGAKLVPQGDFTYHAIFIPLIRGIFAMYRCQLL